MTELFDLNQQLHATRSRLEHLQQQVESPTNGYDPLLNTAIAELALALEELHATAEELHLQNEELLATRQSLEVERQRYQNLFDLAPDAYLVTNSRGLIHTANHATAALLNLQRNMLIGKPLILFIEASCQSFIYEQLEQAAQHDALPSSRPTPAHNSHHPSPPITILLIRDRELLLQPRDKAPCLVSVALSGEYDAEGHLIQLCWVLRDLTERRQAELALRTMTDELQRLYNQAPCGYHSLDSEGRIVRINDTELAMLGYARAEMLGRPITDFFTPTSIQAFAQTYPHFQRRGWIKGLEFQMIRKDGSLLPVSIEAIAVRDADGNYLMSHSIIIDVSERVQLSQERQQVERDRQELSIALSYAVEGISRVDPTGYYLSVNDAYAAMLGYTSTEMLGMHWQSTVHPEDLDQLMAAYQTMQTIGKVDLETCGIRKDGSIFYKQLFMVAIYDDQQQFVGHYCFMKDVSDRKQLELSLRASEAKLNNILNSAIAAIVCFRVFGDRNWEYDYWSAGCEDLFGYPIPELMADKQLWLSQVLPDDLETCILPLFDAFFTLGKASANYRFRRKDGAIRWITSTYAARQISEDTWMVTSVNNDITDLKQAEAALQQQLARESLIAGITHSIRQTLNVDEVLQRTVDAVRQYLQTDRVVIFRFEPNWQGRIVTESVGAEWQPILSTTVYDPCFDERYAQTFAQGHIASHADLDDSELAPCYVNLLASFQAKASLAVPILQGEQLWGLLIAHHCANPRPWPTEEIELLRQLANHLGIALQQSELYQQTRRELLERTLMQAALEESEERFRSLSRFAPIGICQTNANGICLYTNPRWQEMSGRSVEANLGDGWLQAVHPDDRDTVVAGWASFVTGEQPFAQEFRLLKPEGSIHWLLAHAAPLRTVKGDITGYVMTAEEITDRKQTEEALRASESRYRLLFESNPNPTWVFDLETLAFLAINQAAIAHYGYSEAEFLSMTIADIRPPEDVPALLQLQAHRDPKQNYTGTWRHQKKDGTLIDVEITSRAFTFMDKAACLVQVNDITHRKQTEQKIREQAALIDIATDAIFVCDLDDRILFWNRGAERLYGWTSIEVLGQESQTLLRKDSTRLQAELNHVLRRGTWQGEVEKVTKAGKSILVSSRWTLMRDEAGQPESILIVNTDITEKKQLETQFYRAQRLESLGTLASGIAHDLNNALTPILAIAQLMRLTQKNLDQRSQEMVKVLEDSAKRGADLVKQILTFARGGEGKRVPLELPPLLQEVGHVLEQTFPKSIELCIELPDEPIWLVSGDPTQLHQVLLNLCVNARDAMPEGGRLTLSVENRLIDALFAQMNLEAQPGNYVLMTVSDTGTGIAPELCDRIFEPFFTTKGLGQGTGLGLSTVLGIIKNHDGFVQVNSELGVGTDFRVFLPVTDEPSTEIQAIAPLAPGTGGMVLIVDDEVAVQLANQTLLERFNYQTLLAADGIDAIALYAKHQHDIKVVLIDVMMPNMDGITAVRTLQKLNPKVNIIATSGLTSNREQVLAAGAKVFLSKPYSAEELLGTLMTFFGN